MTIVRPIHGEPTSLSSWAWPVTDQVNALTAPGWTPYTATWTALSSNPAIGNGAISAFYRRVAGSDLVHATGRILMGSTTTYGSGRWLLSLPFTASSGTVHVGSAICYDDDTVANHRPATIWLNSATVARFVSTTGDVDASNPFTWAASDQLRWSLTYAAA